jgi:hypothetical protein
MWLIGKVTQAQKKYIEGLGAKIQDVDAYDVEKVVGVVDESRENEEMVVVFIDGDLTKDLEILSKIKKDSKKQKKVKELHKERMSKLEVVWEDYRETAQRNGEDIRSSEPWTCNKDTYEMSYDYFDKHHKYTIFGHVEFIEGSIKIKVVYWDQF